MSEQHTEHARRKNTAFPPSLGGHEVIEVARPVTDEQIRAEDKRLWALAWIEAVVRDGGDIYDAINRMQAVGNITLEHARQAFPEAY